MILLLKSIILGTVIAAPVGPMCILCINRTLNYGLRAGVVTGLGIATADAVYACIVGFGITFVSSFLLAHQFIIRMIGGILLCYLGFNALIKTKVDASMQDNNRTGISDYLSSFVLTITNPMTILTFIAIFSGLGIGSTYAGYDHAITVIIGVFTGSLLWWLLICFAIKAIHKKISTNTMKWINYISGLIIITFGIWAIFAF